MAIYGAFSRFFSLPGKVKTGLAAFLIVQKYTFSPLFSTVKLNKT